MNAQYQRKSDGTLTGPTLQQAVFAGTVDPANIIVVREILTSAEGTDTAVFSDFESNYTITTTGGDGTIGSPGAVTTVQHNSGEDCTDTLHNIEHLVLGDGVDEGIDDGIDDGIDEVIPADGEVIVIVTPTPDTEPAPDPAPVDPAPAPDSAPADPAPAPASDSAAAPGGFSIRTVDSTGAQVGDILTAETGTTRMVVQSLENSAAYRFQVAPAGGGSEPQFSTLSEPVIPGATEDQRGTLDQDAVVPLAAGPVTDQPLAQVPGAARFGAPSVPPRRSPLAALAQCLFTDPGTSVLAITTGGLLAACGLLAYKLYRSRANARSVLPMPRVAYPQLGAQTTPALTSGLTLEIRKPQGAIYRVPPASTEYRRSMFTCSVLRCTNPGSAFMACSQNAAAGYHEAFVCAEHRALTEAGSPWDMEGRNVLMGQDLAPLLENLSARPSVGSEGFTLTLEIAGQIKPFEVFLMPTEARTLSTFIDAANGDRGCA